MKKSRLLNSEISYEIARIGHTSHITICDAGLPIPNDIKRIDLAIENGIPSFISVLDAILSEMEVEEIILASEIKEKNPKVLEEIYSTFEKIGKKPRVTWVNHKKLKEITHKTNAIIRTGECTPYANIILKSGVVF